MTLLRNTSLLVGIVVFTVVEVAALAIWLELVRGSPETMAMALGVGALVAGLSLEQLINDITANGFSSDRPLGRLGLLAVLETGIWAGWLAIAENLGGMDGVLIAGVVLAALLVPLHTVADNVVRREGLLSSIVDVRTVDFSIIEALGATIWLVLVIQSERVEEFWVDTGTLGATAGGDAAVVGLGVLAVALFAEHSVGLRFGLRQR